ncbi:MAG TPA: ThuA domain-containing protein, partial [Verrucomicrobiota bacterium]|nr:ThuA domain-containing protein [Verrucomicrobiota bacterium]
MKTIASLLIASVAATALPAFAADAPKKLLVVSTTAGFRHSSIPTAEKVIAELATQTGLFTVEFVQQPPGEPSAPRRPAPLRENATDEQKQAFQEQMRKYREAEENYRKAKADWDQALKQALARLSPDSLRNYDGVIFANTTGDLPIPDKEGFLDWLRSGKAFIGMHSASDTFANWPEFIEMLGGHFQWHGQQVGVECINEDPVHPSTVHLGKSWAIPQEEIYLFRNYDRSRVHNLLSLDKHPNNGTPGHYPVSWTREYG